MRQNRMPSILLLLAAVGLSAASAVLSTGCGSPAQPSWQALFNEGRKLFYESVADAVARHPNRDRLKPAELAKIRDLSAVYPRLSAILMNYFYQREAPALEALKREASEESLRRFRTKYLDLAKFSAGMFAECLFEPSPHGAYFKDLIPRFKGKDTVDIAVMSTGNMADLNLPSPDKIKPKSLSPEFEKQWGLDAAKFRTAHRLAKGKGVRIAVLDSGIDMTHPVFQNTAWGKHFNFVGRDGFPWEPAGPPMVDWGWHGTVVTSIVAKYAPEAQITVFRYLDADSQNDSPIPLLSTSLMGAAIYKAVHDGNDVVNLSAGTNLNVPYLREACQYAYENNVIVVTGSPYYMGRYLGENEDYPGQFPETIAVTGIAKLGENRYGYWDAAAPESTTDVGSPCAPFVAYPTYVEEKDDYAPGISCAIPIVTSLVALVESVYPRLGTEPPGAYVETVRRLLTENADSKIVGANGFSPEFGAGLINAEQTVQAALRLAEARRVQNPAPDDSSLASGAANDDVFVEGEQIFHRQLKLSLGLRPERQRLRPAEIEKIERGATGIPHLYQNLIGILYWQEAPEFEALRAKSDPAAFREKYYGLCRDAADWFVDSLFCESPRTQELLAASPNLGRGRLDLVLSSLGRNSGAGGPGRAPAGLDSRLFERSPLFAPAKFPQAHELTKGKGVRLAVIDSGWALPADSPPGSGISHGGTFSLTNRLQPPWSAEAAAPGDDSGQGTLMAALASLCAPEAEVRTYRTSGLLESPYEYWPAMELAQAIYKACQDGNDIVLTGAAFSRDFPFLKQACQYAYLRNVLIFAPNARLSSGAAEGQPAYPAAYNSVIAIGGAVAGAGNRAIPWALSSPSRSTAVTGPALAVAGGAPANAAAVGACGGLAALVSTRVPRTGKELPGQYVQRIVEIMESSADPKALGFTAFNPKVGYGMIDSAKAVGPGVETYVKKMTALEDYFNKRMAQRAKQAEEEAAARAAAEKPAAPKKK